MRLDLAQDRAVIFDEMELLFGIYFCDFAPDVHVTKHQFDLFELFFDVSEDRRWVKAATDWGIPVSALFSEDIFIAVLDEVAVVVSFGDEEDELFEEDVVFVCFFEV